MNRIRQANFLLSIFIFTIIALPVHAAASLLPQVQKVEGVAEMKRPLSSAWVRITAGMEIPEGSRIQTKLGSKILMKLDNGSQISLNENSVFEVIKTSQGRYEFKLWTGEARSKVRELRGNRFTISTPVAVAGIRGTDFLLSSEENGRTDLSVYEGKVELKSAASGRVAMVGPNQSAFVSASGELSSVAAGARADEASFIEIAAETTIVTQSAANIPLTISAPREDAVMASRSVMVLGSVAPGKSVSVNGSQAMVDPSGRFALALALNEGVNIIDVLSGSERREIKVTVDSRRPEITLPAYRALTNEPSLTMNVTTKRGATVTAGGNRVVAAEGLAILNFNLTEGENLITITAEDANGLSSQNTIRIVLDTIKPNLIISSMIVSAGGVRVTGITERDATVLANGYNVDIRSDGSFDQVLAGLSASEVTFEAKDAAGNLSRDVRNATGAVDAEPPVFASLSFSPSSVEVGGTAFVSLSVTDLSGVAPSLDLILTGPSGASLSSSLSSSGRSYTGTVSVPLSTAGGSYSPGTIRLADILGNVTTATPGVNLLITNSAPSAPASVTATDATTGGRLTVTWSSVSAADFMDYTLSQGPSSSGPWSQLYSGTANSYAAGSLANGTAYYYVVTSRDISGNVSSPSSVGSGTPSDQVAPSTPGGLSAVAASSSQINLTWSSVSDAASYKVYRSLSAGGGGPWALVTEVFGTSHGVTGLSTGTMYYFSVTALDNNTAPPRGAPNESTAGGNSASATTP